MLIIFEEDDDDDDDDFTLSLFDSLDPDDDDDKLPDDEVLGSPDFEEIDLDNEDSDGFKFPDEFDF